MAEFKSETFKVRDVTLKLSWEQEERLYSEIDVSIKSKDGDESIGSVQKLKHGWAIKKLGEEFIHQRKISIDSLGVFEDAKRAAGALLFLSLTIKDNPLPDEVLAYLKERWNNLVKEKQHLIGELHRIDRDKAWLSAVSKKHGLEFWWDDTDVKEEVKAFVKFMDESNDALYENMGKDFARSLRSCAAAIVRLVDENAAKDI